MMAFVLPKELLRRECQVRIVGRACRHSWLASDCSRSPSFERQPSVRLSIPASTWAFPSGYFCTCPLSPLCVTSWGMSERACWFIFPAGNTLSSWSHSTTSLSTRRILSQHRLCRVPSTDPASRPVLLPARVTLPSRVSAAHLHPLSLVSRELGPT